MNSKQEKDDWIIESCTSDSESDSMTSDEDLADELEDSDSDSNPDLPSDGVIGDAKLPFRFIFDEEAQSRSLDGMAYGIGEDGKYFVVAKDGDFVSGMLVHALIERNIKDGVLGPIASLGGPSEAKMGAESTEGK